MTDFFDELQPDFTGAFFSMLHTHYLDQPHEISLETQALCNAACTFCPYPTIERKGEKMPSTMIYKIIDEMAGFSMPFFFSPFKVNEPLLDTRLEDICKLVEAHVPHAKIRIFSNGAPLIQRHIDWIAEIEPIEHLWISLNSHIPAEYEALMAIPFAKTARRLDNLHGQDFPHQVVLSTVGHPNESFREYCFDRWPKFESVAIQRSEWLGYTHSQVDAVPDTPCSRWFELSIMSSGVVSLCCMDGEGQFPIGDINESSLLEVYNSPAWRVRREQLSSRWAYPACETCTY